MNPWVAGGLLLVFAVHLAAFVLLWCRRRQGYYIALTVTFALLCGWAGLSIYGDAPVVAGRPLEAWLRLAAWGGAAVSMSWTVTRLVRRRRQAGRQNCS